jgi:hypothetical protein
MFWRDLKTVEGLKGSILRPIALVKCSVEDKEVGKPGIGACRSWECTKIPFEGSSSSKKLREVNLLLIIVRMRQ